ncbi:MAG: cysteine dioxygenase family protein [Cyclobacteriaceae bacterium]|nr:cysteine dioxygenase family protein [Cyclobacteriaceae bacterium]
MNNLFSNTAIDTTSLYQANFYRTNEYRTFNTKTHREDPISRNMAFQMATGRIPDLRELCLELADTFINNSAPYSAMLFVPVLKRLQMLDREQIKRLMKNPQTRHVLVSTNRFELVLNLWKPGKASEIHGHPGGGCVFKLLQGKLEELRFTPDHSSKLMGTSSLRSGDMAYIDNSIAYHQVGNPYGSPAISIHAYLK